jgi:hypothetical protein
VDTRDYSGAADLRLMQDLTAMCWRLEGPFVIATIGDLPWWMYQHLNKLDDAHGRLWLENDHCVAWGWLSTVLLFMTHPQRRSLLHDILDRCQASDVSVLEHDRAAVDALESRGYP